MQDAAGGYWATTGDLTVAGTYGLSCLLGQQALTASSGSASTQVTVVPGVIAPLNTRYAFLGFRVYPEP